MTRAFYGLAIAIIFIYFCSPAIIIYCTRTAGDIRTSQTRADISHITPSDDIHLSTFAQKDGLAPSQPFSALPAFRRKATHEMLLIIPIYMFQAAEIMRAAAYQDIIAILAMKLDREHACS